MVRTNTFKSKNYGTIYQWNLRTGMLMYLVNAVHVKVSKQSDWLVSFNKCTMGTDNSV